MMHSLTLGPLELTGSRAFADEEHSFWFEVAAQGTDFGSPQAVTRIVNSLLSDGDLLSYDRDGNRLIPVKVMVCGPDLASVAQGEAALRRVTREATLLTWQPPDDFAPPSVYETLPSPMPRSYDAQWDLDEKRVRRTFTLELTCAPYARSLNSTVVAPLPYGSATITVVDACNSASGWSTLISGGAVATAGGAVVFTTVDRALQDLVRTGSITMTSTRYLIVEHNIAITAMYLNGVGGTATPPVQSRINAAGRLVSVYDTGGVTITSFRALVKGVPAGTQFAIHEVSRSASVPQVSTRQFSRVIEVGGTERTPASIRVASPNGTDPLILTMVSTSPTRYAEAGFDPAFSRWYVAGTRTPDTSTVSGYRFRVDDGYFQADIPARSAPDGAYQMVTLARASVAGTYRFQSAVQQRQSGATIAEWIHEEIVSLGTDWLLIDLGVPSLPVLRTYSGSDMRWQFRATQPNGSFLSGVTVECMDAWAFPVDEDCGLTMLQTARPYLWLDSPDLASGVQRVWEGSTADRAGSRFPALGIHTFGQHILTPPMTGLTVVTSGPEYPQAQAEYYTRWPHNAAE